jgi:hypothetical protein
MAQRCSWIFRAYKYPIDNWRFDLHKLAPGNNVLLIRACDINKDIHPVLHGLASAYEKFYSLFSLCNTNYIDGNIFANEAFRRPEAPEEIIGKNFFGLNFYNENEVIIRNLRYSDCFRNGVFKSVRDWQEDGLNINLNTWLRLRNAMLFSKRNLSTNIGTLETVSDFSARLKKGSRKIRRFFDN